MELNEWTKKVEDAMVAYNNEMFNKYAGLDFNEQLIKEKSTELLELARYYLEHENELDGPRKLKIFSVGRVISDKKLDLTLKLFDLRNKIISIDKYEVNDQPVNWGSWRQFNSIASDEQRKEVFDEFIKKAPRLEPYVEEQFNISREIAKQHGETILDIYLEHEGLTWEQLERMVIQLGESAREPFLEALDYYSKEINGRAPEYYDDFYFFRGKVFKPLNKIFSGMDPVKNVTLTLEKMGISTKGIKVDDADRPKKHPSAMCFSIHVPTDVRILYRKVSPFTDHTSVYHEMGHGIHSKYANPTDPLWKRYMVAMNVAETFSIFVENLMEYPPMLHEQYNLEARQIKDLRMRRHFINLYFLTFYAANSLLKLYFWKHRLSFDEMKKKYEELTKRFMGYSLPGEYWLLHHIMPNYDLYAPSYLVAGVRVGEFYEFLRNEHDDDWWKKPAAGEIVKKLASERAEVKFEFSRLDPRPYIEHHADFNLD